MSVYSGFSTRKLETVYGRLTEELLSLLTWRVMCCLNQETVNEEAWGHKFLSIYKQMLKLETQKYHPPKLAPICSDISDFFSSRLEIPSNHSYTPLSYTDEVGPLIKEPLFPQMKTRYKRKRGIKTNSYSNDGSMRQGIKTPMHSKRNHYENALQEYLQISDRFDKLKRNVAKELNYFKV